MFSFSPRLIAAYHVFHRLPTPRHPPDALVNLFSKKLPSQPYSIVYEQPFRAARSSLGRNRNNLASAAGEDMTIYEASPKLLGGAERD